MLGMNQVSMVMTAFANTSVTPPRFFTDEAAAIAWLLQPST
ncbi:hypothetical protein [Arthrobacter sp. TB 23]|nr:hypothetical protein [Arthrobacter sp. TB 23]